MVGIMRLEKETLTVRTRLDWCIRDARGRLWVFFQNFMKRKHRKLKIFFITKSQ